VDNNRNIAVIDFNANNKVYTLSGGSLVLSSGGTIKTSGAGADHNADTVSSPITLANANAATSGTLSILGLSSNAERGLVISGGITGAATDGASTLTLGGTTVSATGARQNKITGDIANGLGGGTLAVEKTGTGLWVLEGAKTFTGGLTIREGELRIAGSGAAAGNGPITLGNSTGTAAATFSVVSSITPTNALTVASGSSGIKTLTVGNVATPGYNGAITLNDSLTVSVANSSTGNTNFTLGGVSGISLNANTLKLLVAPANSSVITSTITVSNAVSGTGALEIVGAGNNNNATRVVAINGTNSYTGGTTVAASGTDKSLTVNVSGNQSAANGGWTISNPGPNTNTYTVNFLSGSTIGVAAGKDMTLLNGGGIKALNVAGTVTTGATGNLNIRGNSALTLDSGANWTQNGGTINIQPQNSATNAVMNVNSGADFTYAGGNNINLAKATGTAAGSATLNLSGGTFTTGRGFSNALAGTGSGTSNLNFSSGGTLKLSADIASLISVGTNVSTGGGIIDTNTFSTALDVGVSGAGGLTKAGSGTLTLNVANTYAGATNVNGGTLVINGIQSLATGAVTVNATATLKGNGTIGGATTINGTAGSGNEAIHAPGTSVGKQTIANDLSYGQHSIFEWELASNTETGRGTAFDAVDLTGVGSDLSIHANAVYKIILGTDFDAGDSFWTADRSWDVFSVGGTSTTAFANFALYNASDPVNAVSYSNFGSFNYSFASNTGTLSWVPVPEPTSALAGLLLTSGLLRRRRPAAVVSEATRTAHP
jgi:autotransporter-associated beta strand protein